MPSYDIRPLQLRLLNILLQIDEAFRRAGLRYYLIDGSLIGAVREQGFIPWDDDMDIGVPRADYERLIREADEILPKPLEFVCYENDPTYPLHFGKIQDASTTLIERPHLYYLGGVYVDIFPIDGAPDGAWAQRMHCFRYDVLRKLIYYIHRDPYRHGHGPSSWVPLLTRKLFTMPQLQAKIKREMMRYDFERTRLVGVNLNDGRGAMIPREALGEPTPIAFEGERVMGMADNDLYLSKLFGDYMTPPSAENRHQHNFFFMDLDKPYAAFDKSQLQ